MKKKIMQFFLTMMILADDRLLSYRLDENVPIVDTYGNAFGLDDEWAIIAKRSKVHHFFLDDAGYHIQIGKAGPNRIIMNFSQYGNFAPTGFSRILEKDLCLN